MQDYHYTFDCGTRLEKLTFRTFKSESSEGELTEIQSVKGDPVIMKKMNGFAEGRVVEREHAENARQSYRKKNSLIKGNKDGSKAIIWKLYYTPDMGKAEPEEEFAGFIGVSLLESKLLEPHIALTSKYLNKRLGTKAFLSVIAKLLTRKDWLLENVAGVFMCVQARNTECLALIDKLGLNQIVELSNPRRKDGVWQDDYEFSTDKKTRTLDMRHFICNSDNFLISLFETFTQPTMNKRNYLLLYQAINAGMLLNDVEASLQQFAFLFDDGSKKDKLVFKTMKRPGSQLELEEIISLFGDVETMQYYGSEATIGTLKDAAVKREQMREEISFDGMHRTIGWRVSYVGDSTSGYSEVFIGFVKLANPGRTLEPGICLHTNYRQKGLRTKIMMCLIVKALKHKLWLKETFDDIVVTLHPENTGSLSLKDTILGGLDVEETNDERDDGLWKLERTVENSGSKKIVTRRRFRSACFPVLQRALMLKQSRTFKRKCLSFYDKHNRKNYTLSPIPPCPSLGVKPVDLYRGDALDIMQKLISRDATPIEAEVQIVNSFDVTMPLRACRTSWRAGTFLLFFFAEGCEIKSFEAPEYPSQRRHIEQKYIAFQKMYRTQRMTVRMPNQYTGTLKAYLAELDLDVFEKESALRGGLRNLWTSTEFHYCRNKRRRWPSEFAHMLDLNEAKLSDFGLLP